jgi:hypothetical protein
MRMPSWIVLVLIVIGGIMVVVGNIEYPRARAREDKQRLANDARTILLPEMKRNSEIVLSMQSALEARHVPMEKFDVTAWETISKGGLLLGLEQSEIAKYLRVYGLVYRANDLSAELLDAATGVRSALQDSQHIKDVFVGGLQSTLKELQVALASTEPKKVEVMDGKPAPLTVEPGKGEP